MGDLVGLDDQTEGVAEQEGQHDGHQDHGRLLPPLPEVLRLLLGRHRRREVAAAAATYGLDAAGRRLLAEKRVAVGGKDWSLGLLMLLLLLVRGGAGCNSKQGWVF